jgi:acyl-CoA thioesterase-1
MRKSILLSCLIVLFSCSKNEAQTVENNGSVNLKVLRYLALGDSYTIGTAIGSDNAYPEIFGDSLRQDKRVDSLLVEVIAKNGWTTTDLISGIELGRTDADYNLVTLLIGVNNQYQGGSIAKYELEFRALLKRAIEFVGGDSTHVLVISIPDWGASPAGAGNRAAIAEEIDDFNLAQEQIAIEEGVQFVDITTISRNGLSDSSLIASDGLHFSKKMHRQWLDLLYPILKGKLELQ